MLASSMRRSLPRLAKIAAQGVSVGRVATVRSISFPAALSLENPSRKVATTYATKFVQQVSPVVCGLVGLCWLDRRCFRAGLICKTAT
jgi:hypothetical protein